MSKGTTAAAMVGHFPFSQVSRGRGGKRSSLRKRKIKESEGHFLWLRIQIPQNKYSTASFCVIPVTTSNTTRLPSAKSPSMKRDSPYCR